MSEGVLILYEQLLFNEDRFLEYKKLVTTFIENDAKCMLRPLEVSVPVCSQHGWMSIKTDLLSCSSCYTTLRPTLPQPDDHKYSSVVSEVKYQIRSAHKSHCPWKFNPFPDRYVYMIPGHKREVLEEFLYTVSTLLPLIDELPKSAENENTELSKEDYSHLFSLMNVTEDSPLRNLVNWALAGWSSENGLANLLCQFCQRRINCNTFSLKESNMYEPVKEHRNWCRWLVSIPADGLNQELFPGWMKFRKMLLSCRKINKRK